MIEFTVQINNNQWSKRVKRIKNIINNVLRYKKDLKFLNNMNYYCNIVLTNDKIVKSLNKKFKKVNLTTDVLTFVSKQEIKSKKKEKYCDIFFSIETIKKDAKKNKIEFYTHLTHLIIHSFLHINDYVHDKLEDFVAMKNIEIKILKKLNIESPY
tara:strand:+ start:1172 stop:1636 length:465 start_codon:yes stop_codon:yes gene_type:complete